MNADEWEWCKACGHQHHPRKDGKCPKCGAGGFNPLHSTEPDPEPVAQIGSYGPAGLTLAALLALMLIAYATASVAAINLSVAAAVLMFAAVQLWIVGLAFRIGFGTGLKAVLIPFYHWHFALNVTNDRTLRGLWAVAWIGLLLIGWLDPG